jgi:hypothetical protein
VLSLNPLEVAMRKSTAIVAVALLFAMFAFQQDRPRAAQKAAGVVQRWEYDVISIGTTDVVGGGKHELNRKGKDGWELCGASLDTQFKQAYFIPKRPAQ